MIQSSLTERFQTTIPKGVREALGLRRGDTLAYEVRGEEVVVRRRPEQESEDPALAGFIDLLERDIAAHPERLRRVPDALVQRGRELVDGVEVNFDDAL